MNNQNNFSLPSILTTALLSTLLIGCGGGGGSDSAPSTASTSAPSTSTSTSSTASTTGTTTTTTSTTDTDTTTNTNESPTTEVPPVQIQPEFTELSLEETNEVQLQDIVEITAQTTHDITVPEGFSLNSERLFNLKIMRSETDNQAAYLSVCSDYQHNDDGSYVINYNSCLLRTSLGDINYETVISVTNDTQGVVAALWFIDTNKEPLIVDWRF